MRKYVCTVTRPLLVVKGPNGHKIRPRVGIGAHARIRTGDLFLTKEMLYRLSYVGGLQPDSICYKLNARSCRPSMTSSRTRGGASAASPRGKPRRSLQKEHFSSIPAHRNSGPGT